VPALSERDAAPRSTLPEFQASVLYRDRLSIERASPVDARRDSHTNSQSARAHREYWYGAAGHVAKAPLAATASYAYIRSRETDAGQRVDVPLTPRHNVSLVGMWEKENRGDWSRVLHHGPAAAGENPFRAASEPYVIFGIMENFMSRSISALPELGKSHQRPPDQMGSLLRQAAPWMVAGRSTHGPLGWPSINGGLRVIF